MTVNHTMKENNQTGNGRERKRLAGASSHGATRTGRSRTYPSPSIHEAVIDRYHTRDQ